MARIYKQDLNDRKITNVQSPHFDRYNPKTERPQREKTRQRDFGPFLPNPSGKKLLFMPPTVTTSGPCPVMERRAP